MLFIKLLVGVLVWLGKILVEYGRLYENMYGNGLYCKFVQGKREQVVGCDGAGGVYIFDAMYLFVVFVSCASIGVGG